jgi:cysteine synthase A
MLPLHAGGGGATLRTMSCSRAWIREAVRIIEADFNRSADTHLLPLPLPAHPRLQVYFKDESSHPTGSLKHRLARSLFLYGLANGWIHAGSTIVESSSGSTAVSEAYFARLLGLPFVAVMPRSTSPDKIAAIEFYGGRCHFVEHAAQADAAAAQLAHDRDGHYMDQFTYAERATDWRGNNNIAESLFAQMACEPHPEPRYVVCAAGTGGTSATLARYVRYRRFATEIVVADPDHSVFFDYYVGGDGGLTADQGSRIEGIGRPRVEASFLRDAVDGMVKVPDALAIAAIHWLETALGRRVGGSTGTILAGALPLMQRMSEHGESGALVLVLCDGGERYRHSYYDAGWLAANGFDPAPDIARLDAFLRRGQAQDWRLREHWR